MPWSLGINYLEVWFLRTAHGITVFRSMKNTIARKGNKTAAKASASASKVPQLVAVVKIHTQEVVIRKRVGVALMVPSEFAALLGKPGECAFVGSASVSRHQISQRVSQWHRRHVIGANEWCRPMKDHLAAILEMPLNTQITLAFKESEWERINAVCDALRIQPAEWLLAAVHFNATLPELQLSAGGAE